ncbi:enhanced serine sensitivity protein SseB [Paenibacillus puldeungensis]|uniref:Enhanced serine sensitivity protein SseB n=1 Tax=Paenibacillus puldeungensis TaxID=696536 RepID=A0ABW3S603_9BACL
MNDQRKDEIGRKFLLNGPLVEAECLELKIQELIFLIHSGEHFKENKAFINDDFDERIKFFHNVLLEKVNSSEALYMAYDKNTNYPFLDASDRVWLFSEEEFAASAEDYFMQQLLMLEMKKISKENIIKTLAELHMLGISKLLIDNGQYTVELERDDLLPPPDWTGTPEISIPVTNPRLQHALIRFFQTLYAKNNDENRNQLLHMLEDQMLDEVVQAKYLIPMQLKEEEPAVPNDQGVVTVNKGTIIQFGVLSAQDETNWLPAFTDWNEFEKAYDKTVWSSNIGTYDDLLALSENMKGIVINCHGLPLRMDENNKKMIEEYRKARQESPAEGIEKHTIEEDTQVLLGEPKEYPHQMIDAVKEHMKKQKGIKKAYLRLMIKDGEQSYLIIVDFEGNPDEVFAGISRAATPHLNGMILNMMEMDGWENEVKELIPFYKKKRFGLL